MEQFSQASAAAACSGLSAIAHSAAVEMQAKITASAAGNHVLHERLSFLAARLQKFGEHVGQLGHCLADASVVHPRLAGVLGPALIQCAYVVSAVPGGLEQEHKVVDVEAIAHLEAFLAASSRLLVFATQLLTIENEQEQQSKLASQDAQDILDTARRASQAALPLGLANKN